MVNGRQGLDQVQRKERFLEDLMAIIRDQLDVVGGQVLKYQLLTILGDAAANYRESKWANLFASGDETVDSLTNEILLPKIKGFSATQAESLEILDCLILYVFDYATDGRQRDAMRLIIHSDNATMACQY